MTEALGHDGDFDARGHHERRLTVSQVVQSHAAQASRVDQGREQLGYVVGAQWVAVLAGEHEVMVGVRVAPRGPLGVLAHAVGEQGAHGALVEVDDATLACLGLRLAERHAHVPGIAVRAWRRRLLVLLPTDLLYDLLPHGNGARLGVDVGPAQAHGLAAAQAGAGDNLEQGAEAVRADAVEELAELGGLPRLHLRAALLGQLDLLRFGRVVRDQVLLRRGRECARQRRVNAADGGALALAVVEVGEQLVDVSGAQVAQA
ncbi:hypothetical protein V9K83_14560 [Streptomyces griseoaurantiacus]